jgi:acyl-CoA thioesterase-1
MVKRIWSIGLALLLAACGSASTDEGATRNAEQSSEINDSVVAEIPVMGPQRRILAFGDSLFAGYGVGKENSYPAKLQSALRARGINAQITNAGISGDTSAAGQQRLAFTLEAQEEKPELFILELGGNDLLRGVMPDETRRNLIAMLEELNRREIPVLLMGMRSPPNYGPEYQAQFDAMYRELAERYDTALIPFWLEAIYEDQSLFQDDRIHPTEEGLEALVDATVEQVAQAIPPAQNGG